MDFFSRQDLARRNTLILILYFFLAVVLIILAVNLVFAGVSSYDLFGNNQTERAFDLFRKEYWYSQHPIYVSAATLALMAIGNIMVYFDIKDGGHTLAKMSGATPVDLTSSDPLIKRYINVVEEMSIASGVLMPSLYINKQEDGINAFVAGITPNNTVLSITQGALEKLSRDALQGVIGHEFSHIFHADMRINMRLIGTVTGITMIGEIGALIMRSTRYGMIGHSRRSSRDNPLAAIVAVLLFGLALFIIGYVGLFFGRLIKASISRQREYLADASSVQYTRNKLGIAEALTTILNESAGSNLKTKEAEKIAHMCFAKSFNMSQFFSTHPPLKDRINSIYPGYLALHAIGNNKQQSQGTDDTNNSSNYSHSEQLSSFAGNNNSFNINNQEIVDSIGSPQPIHLDIAKSLLTDMPDKLHIAAYNRNDSRALIYAMILAKMNINLDPAMSIIESNDSLEIQEKTKTYINEFTALADNIRLPLIEICLPVLNELSYNKKVMFIKTCIELVSQDSKLAYFEFIILVLIRSQLINDAKHKNKQNLDIKKVTQPIGRVLSTVVHFGKNNAPDKVFSQYMSRIVSPGKSVTLTAISECKVNLISDDLNELSKLSPKHKKALLKLLIDCIHHDFKILPEEADIIRIISLAINCPIPPITPTAVD